MLQHWAWSCGIRAPIDGFFKKGWKFSPGYELLRKIIKSDLECFDGLSLPRNAFRECGFGGELMILKLPRMSRIVTHFLDRDYCKVEFQIGVSTNETSCIRFAQTEHEFTVG